MLQSQDKHLGHFLPSKSYLFPNATVLNVDNPQCEVTCKVSGSRKRMREDALPSTVDQALLRMNESAATSTSGRQSNALSPVAQEIMARICHQNIEIDTYVRLQNEKLRLGMEEAKKQHVKSLLFIIEQSVAKRLKEKETELQIANRKNAELEDKIRQIVAENQIWFNLAKSNEEMIYSLRTTIEQILLQKAAAAAAAAAAQAMKEGYGDSDGTTFPADDAQSFCFGKDTVATAGLPVATMPCKVCGKNEVCVLVLPCRHLCLCKDCENLIHSCPICKQPKNACLRIYMS